MVNGKAELTMSGGGGTVGGAGVSGAEKKMGGPGR